jgi:hypothetical protein
MLTIIYPEAFTRKLSRPSQGTGFGACFAREQVGNRHKVGSVPGPRAMGL